MPAERWPLDGYYHEDKKNPDTTYCKKAALVEGFEFNPGEFRIPRATYMATDTAQWMALQAAMEALEDAGVLDNINAAKTGVIIGNTLTGEVSRASVLRYRWPYVKRVFAELLDNFEIGDAEKSAMLNKVEERYKHPFPPVNEDNLAGGLSNTIAGRICNYFDFKGGGFSTDGACSSSLLAINQACIGLQHGACDYALAGGVDISLDPFEVVGFAKVGALSDTDIRVYDQNSNGFLPGEGCGIVVLQRLEDAIEHGNKVYAVVNGIGISSDGKGGITAPSVSGQTYAVDRAYELCEHSFADVELIEGHGTGTPTGDIVELTTFVEGKERHKPDEGHRCGIGSIKSNIGHTKAAAGVAGFIKAVMASCYGIMPPTQGIRRPNVIFKKSPYLYPLLTGRNWQPKDGVRRAAVSSAGFGGINTHITLSAEDSDHLRSQPEDRKRYLSLLSSNQSSEAFLVGGDTIIGLHETLELLLDAAKRISMAELTDLSHYCVQNYTGNRLRLAVVASTPDELESKLLKVMRYLSTISHAHEADLMDTKEGIFLNSDIHQPRVAFLFPGQASQSINMGRWIKERSDTVSRFWDSCDEVLQPLLGQKISDIVFRDSINADESTLSEWTQQLNDTSITQPAITVASLAVATFLRDLGVRPDLAIGHSLGEYAALCSAGVLDVSQTLKLVSARGKAMSESSDQPGAMLSIGAGADKVREILAKTKVDAVISNINSPKQTVISGESSEIDAASQAFRDAGLSATRLPVSSAFHSKLMQSASDRMAAELKDAKFSRLRHLVITPSKADFISDQMDMAELLTQQILEPVDYVGSIEAAINEECEVFVEVGPGSVLTDLTKSILSEKNVLVCSSDIGDHGQHAQGLNLLVAYLYVCGVPLNLQKLHEGRFFRPISLPYSQQFIASPCEYEVPALDLGIKEGSIAGSGIVLDGIAEEGEKKSSEPGEPVDAESEEAILIMLKDYIMSEFGYSEDIVTADAHLQEDLGLDSLKSVEVAHEVMGALGLQGDVSHLQNASLRELALFIQQLKTGETPVATESEEKVNQDLPNWVRAFDRRITQQAIGEVNSETLSGSFLLVYEQQDKLVAALQKQLSAAGAQVHAIKAGEEQWDGAIDSCIVLANQALPIKNWLSTDQVEAHYARPKVLLSAAQSLLKNNQGQAQHFALVTEQGGRFGQWSEKGELMAEAGAAFLKTLHLENQHIQTRCIDFNSDISVSRKAQLIIEELLHGNGHLDAGYTDKNSRVTSEYQPTEIAALPSVEKPLSAGDVVLITGGGKGITAECAITLAQKTGVKLALVGSSPLAENYADASDELSLNMQRFKEAGITCQYYSCNVLDKNQVQQLFTDVAKELGPVNAVIHAAGVNNLQKIDGAEWERFERVLKPKMEGLVNLLSAADVSKLKSLMAFSSVIGCSGMAGNSDYAYANEWMGQLLRRFQQRHPQIQCCAFAYSVWAEVGMGARLKSVDLLGNMGISAIPVEAGTDIFVRLTEKVWPDNELVIASRMGSLGTIRFNDWELPRKRFLDNILQWQPGVEMVNEIFLDPQIDHFLIDHNYEGSLLFPAVMGIEAMVQSASACRSTGFVEQGILPQLENLEFSRAIIVPPKGRSIRVYVQVGEPLANGEQRARVAIRSSVTNYDQDYFSAECVWYPDSSNVQLDKVERKEQESLPLQPMEDLYGKILFQGPMFQNIESYLELSATHCVVAITLPEENRLFHKDTQEFTPVFGLAQVRDTFLHAVQLCVPKYRILPVSMERVFFTNYSGKKVYLHATEREKTDTEFLYDLEIYDEKGQCIELITGFRCRIMADYEDKDNLKVILSAHEKSAALEVA